MPTCGLRNSTFQRSMKNLSEKCCIHGQYSQILNGKHVIKRYSKADTAGKDLHILESNFKHHICIANNVSCAVSAACHRLWCDS